MRVLVFAAGGDIGGGKTHILNIVNELSKNNELRLVCFRIGEMSEDAKAMGIDTLAIDVKEGWFATRRLAFDQARTFKPDIIHCHGAKANFLGILVKNTVSCPVMTTVHSDPRLDYLSSFWKRISYGNINAWSLKRMDYYTAVSDRMMDILIDRGYNPKHMGVVYNGLDFSDAVIESRPSKSENDIVTIGIAARLNPVKDVSTTVKAFALAYKKNKRLRLSIAGTGVEEEYIKALVNELGLNDVIKFEGWITDMKAYFKGIDINVLSSISETFPYSILEGAYMHCPAISSNVGSIALFVEHEKCGLIFERGDVDTFADHMLRLAGDDELRREYGDRLFERARNLYSLEKMGLEQQQIYERAVRVKNHE